MEWFSSLAGFEQVSFVIACIGSAFFAIKLVTQSLGIGDDVDMDADADVDGDAGDGDHPPAVVGLNLFSVHGLALGIAIGGWSAMAAFSISTMVIVSGVVGVVLGFLAMLIHAKIMAVMANLQEDTTVNLEHAVGLIGTVYLSIPKAGAGAGKISLVMYESMDEYAAISQESEPIPTYSKVRVVGVSEDNELIVQPLSEEDAMAALVTTSEQ